MEGSDRTAEQRQLLVEIEAVTKNISAAKASGKAYEAAQGRELIEKADSLGLPADACEGLRRALGD